MHLLGSWKEHKTKDLGYINIPRCASTSITRTFRRGWTVHSTPPPKGKPLFVVTRAPWGRYISGLCEFAKRNELHAPTVARNLIKGGTFWETEFRCEYRTRCNKVDPERRVILDEHTAPQDWFLEPFVGHNVSYFDFDQLWKLPLFLEIDSLPSNYNASSSAEKEEVNQIFQTADERWWDAWKATAQ